MIQLKIIHNALRSEGYSFEFLSNSELFKTDKTVDKFLKGVYDFIQLFWSFICVLFVLFYYSL